MVITFSPLVHLATGHPKSELDDWFYNHIIRPYVLDTKVKSGAKLSTNQNQVVRGCSLIRGPDLQDLQFPPPAQLWQHSEGDWWSGAWSGPLSGLVPGLVVTSNQTLDTRGQLSSWRSSPIELDFTGSRQVRPTGQVDCNHSNSWSQNMDVGGVR